MFELDPFLRRVKLIEDFNIEVPTGKDSFKKKLEDSLERDKHSFWFGYYSSKSLFDGDVVNDGFEIKKNIFSGNKKVTVKAYGSLIEINHKTKINVEIHGLDPFMKLWYGGLIFFLIVCMIIITASLFSNKIHGTISGFFGMLLFFTIAFLLSYYMIKIAMRNFKDDLEREFYYLAKQQDTMSSLKQGTNFD